MADTGSNVKTAIQIALGAAALLAIYKLMQKFGLIQTASESKEEQATTQASGSSTEVDFNNPMLSFNPNYFQTIIKDIKNKNNKAVVVLDIQRGTLNYYDLSNQVYDAKGFFHDDNEKLYSVFRNIQTQFQLSNVAFYFNLKYKKDMLEYIKSFLNSDEIERVFDIVKNYPLLKKTGIIIKS